VSSALIWRTADNWRLVLVELTTRRYLYMSDVMRAYLLWQAGIPDVGLKILEQHMPGRDQVDLRDFEWYYVWRLYYAPSHPELYEDSKKHYISIAFSEDDRLIALGDIAGTVELRDAATMKEIKSVNVITRGDLLVCSVALSGNGRLLASGDRSGLISVRDPSSGVEALGYQADDGGRISSLALNSDGARLAAVTSTGDRLDSNGDRNSSAELLVLDVTKGKKIFGTGRHGSCPSLRMTQAVVAYRPDGTLMVAGERPRAVEPFQNGRSMDYVSVETIPFNRDFSVTTSEPTRFVLSLPRDSSITAMGLSLQGDRLAVACSSRFPSENEVRVLNLATPGELNTILHGRLNDWKISDVKFAPNGTRLAVAHYGLRYWDVGADPEPYRMTWIELSSQMAVSDNGERVAWTEGWRPWASQDGGRKRVGVGVGVYATATGKRLFGLTPKSPVASMGFDADGGELAIGTIDGSVTLSMGDEGTDSFSFKAHDGSVAAIAVSRTSGRIATAERQQRSDRSVLRIWAVEGRTARLLDSQVYDGEIARLAFDLSGSRLAVAIGLRDARGERSVDEIVRVREVTSKNTFGPFKSRAQDQVRNATPLKPSKGIDLFDPPPVGVYAGSGLTSPRFSPDGRLLAFGSAVWDVDSGKPKFLIEGDATCFAFSREGRRLASGEWYGAVRLWDVSTGKEILALRKHGISALDHVVLGVGFSNCDMRLVACVRNAILCWNTADRKSPLTIQRTAAVP
jgi:WD40 repeat protein